MNSFYRQSSLYVGFTSAVLLALLVQTGQAQDLRGFVNTAEAVAGGEEIKSQENLWVLEVNYKNMRMIPVEITDPKTKIKKLELVWYFVYRVINRPVDRQVDTTDTVPANVFDAAPSKAIFVPEFTLVSDDNGVQRIYPDEIIPEAQSAIERRERMKLQNSIEIVQPIPPESPKDAKAVKALYGVAMWKRINAETDFFSLILSGFSNGVKLVRGPVAYDDLKMLADDGKLLRSDQVWHSKIAWKNASEVKNLYDDKKPAPANAVAESWYYTFSSDRLLPGEAPPLWRKTLIQQYWRPGDKFDQGETEIRHKGESNWLYRPIAAKAKGPANPAAATSGAPAPAGAPAVAAPVAAVPKAAP